MNGTQLNQFTLAPMGPWIRFLTWILFLIPLTFFYFSMCLPSPLSYVFGGLGFFISFLYIVIWLWFRPREFVLKSDHLEILWPLRKKRFLYSDFLKAEIITLRQFRQKYGWGMRIGAGGLWGGFGLLMTSQQTFAMYISRMDRMAILTFKNSHPLLITPNKPEEFIQKIFQFSGRPHTT